MYLYLLLVLLYLYPTSAVAYHYQYPRMATKPIIAFVPGAYHEPLAYDLLLPSLHLAGYQTTAISLPSVRGPSNMTDFGPDVAAIRNVVGGLVELGREVVVVSHSYGGTPATEAMRGLGKKQREAQGLLGGVVQLIYIAAGVPLEGENFAQSIVVSGHDGA